MAISPMMQQYLEIKEQNKDHILFFRLGDFYEMFYDDAKLVSRLLDLTLTGKQCGEDEKAPMCGVPYHSADTYIGRLIDNGYSVAICEQTEDPATAKGLVKRDVIRIITPGTVTDSNQLAETKNNYIASVYFAEGSCSVCFADITTGDIRATFIENSNEGLVNELAIYSPKEVIVSEDISAKKELRDYLVNRQNAIINPVYSGKFSINTAKSAMLSVYSMTFEELKKIRHELVTVTGMLLSYILETQKTDISYLKSPVYYESGNYLEIDVNSRRSLELCRSMRSGEKRGTLLWVLDKTESSMGSRMLASWIEQPLVNCSQIEKRQGAVAELYSENILCDSITEELKKVLDLERLMTRVIYGSANAKDMRGIFNTVSAFPEIKKYLACCKSTRLGQIYSQLDTLSDLAEIIGKTIVEDPPFSVREGGFVQKGVNDELDRLRDIMQNSKGYLEKLENDEKNATGIKNLKVGYNRVFGYYIEVSKTGLADVPDRYIRKQTLTTGERYITSELKELEGTILNAADKINAIEYAIFSKLKEHLSNNIKRIQCTAELVAEVDVYCSLAKTARENGYVCPEVDIGYTTEIKEGRHPVVEQFVSDGGFVPNDTVLDVFSNRFLIITGPNMAGKSTYMRQVALITIMAQIGSFVPAQSARIGIVDKVFTRIGASDDLASGQSTFMLEMNEVAYILKNATKRSLIIYDEIGRGTSTFDGMSIAGAVVEYTAGKKLGARTLFATHYHEIADMGKSIDGCVNYHIAARKKGDGVVFMRKIIPGAADESYGIEVASLAGIPKDVIKKAKEILKKVVEEGGGTMRAKPSEADVESYTIDDYLSLEIKDRIRAIDINTLTPLEALNIIWELKKTLG